MDIYDVLRKLVEARGFQAHEQAEAIDIIEDCRRLNVFGTLSKSIIEEHEHDWIPWPTGRLRCQVCGEERNHV